MPNTLEKEKENKNRTEKLKRDLYNRSKRKKEKYKSFSDSFSSVQFSVESSKVREIEVYYAQVLQNLRSKIC